MSHHLQPAGRVLGSIHADGDGRGTVRMASVYDTTPDDLWSALTELPRLARWIANVEGDLRAGGTFSASFTSGWEGPGRVDACVPPRQLLVTLDPGTSDETTIEATLSPEGSGTRLVVEERGIPLDEIGAHGAGWQVHMEDLGTYLSGGEPPGWRTRWIELAPAYEDLSHGLE
jgi:uncharacterized protein YndB with AHSA1/START domain